MFDPDPTVRAIVARSRIARTIPLLLAVLTATAAQAAPQSSAQRPERQSEETILVRARPLDSVGISITEIDEQLIESANVRTVAELLEYVAGARVISSGSRGGLSNLELRGGDPNFVLVLLDGVPLNDPTDIEGGAVNLSSLTISGVQQIEVARGPLSFFYGSTALSGVVNIVTRRGSTDTPQVRGSLEAGGDSLVRADASVAGLARGGDYFAGFDWEQQDGHVGEDTYEAATVQGSFGLPVTEAGVLRLSTRFATWQADDYPESSGGPVFGSGELRHADTTELSLGGDLAWDAGDTWSHRLVASYARREMERDSPGVFPLVPPSIEHTEYGHARAGWLTGFEPTGESRVSAGIDVDHESGTNVSTLFLPPFFGGDVSGDYRLSRTTPGLFAEGSVSHGALAVEGGLRADFPDGPDTELSPRLGARYTFAGAGTALRAATSRGFKLPSFFAVASPPQLGGNPDLRPETSVGFDLGVDQRLADLDMTLSLTVFWIRYEDLVDFDFDLFRNVNRDRVDANGVELALRWQPDPRVTVLADVTYQSVENPDSDEPLRNKPDWTGSVRVGFRPLAPLQLRVEAAFASESFDVQIAVPDRDMVDGYAVVDLAAIWDAHASWQVTGRVDNLTDTDYEHFIGFPQPGITARAGIRYTLR